MVTLLVKEATQITVGQPLEVLTPHQVRAILEIKGHLWMTGECLTRYQAVLIDNPEVVLNKCNTLNPASLMPVETIVIHHCKQVISQTYASRTDLRG